MTEPKIGWWRHGEQEPRWHAGKLPQSLARLGDLDHLMMRPHGDNIYVSDVWFKRATYLGDGPEPVEVGVEEEEDDDSMDERMGALEALVRNLMASTTTNSSRLTKRVDILEESFHTLDALVNKIEKLLIAANIDERLNEMNIRLARDQAQRAAGSIEFGKRLELIEAKGRDFDARIEGFEREFAYHGRRLDKLEHRVDALSNSLCDLTVATIPASVRRVVVDEQDPEPFRVTSLGLYQRRDGGVEPIVRHEPDNGNTWENSYGMSWADDGSYDGIESPHDLVARIGDLPEKTNG